MSFIGMTKDGRTVVDRPNSHVHLGARYGTHLKDALARIAVAGRKFVVEEVDFGQPIGQSVCVATTPVDEIIFAQREGRVGLTRFVKNRVPEACSSLCLILKQGDGRGGCDEMALVTAFVGRKPEPEPWDTRAFAQAENSVEAEARARSFWASHALVWGSEPIIKESETQVCPW